jgi:hypothetical protein
VDWAVEADDSVRGVETADVDDCGITVLDADERVRVVKVELLALATLALVVMLGWLVAMAVVTVLDGLDVGREDDVDNDVAEVGAAVVFESVLDVVEVGGEVAADDVASRRLGMSQAATSPTVAAEDRETRLDEAMLKM